MERQNLVNEYRSAREFVDSLGVYGFGDNERKKALRNAVLFSDDCFARCAVDALVFEEIHGGKQMSDDEAIRFIGNGFRSRVQNEIKPNLSENTSYLRVFGLVVDYISLDLSRVCDLKALLKDDSKRKTWEVDIFAGKKIGLGDVLGLRRK